MFCYTEKWEDCAKEEYHIIKELYCGGTIFFFFKDSWPSFGDYIHTKVYRKISSYDNCWDKPSAVD